MVIVKFGVFFFKWAVKTSFGYVETKAKSEYEHADLLTIAVHVAALIHGL